MSAHPVMDLEADRWTAVLENDFDSLDALTHPDLTYTHSNAVVDTKQSWIESMTSGMVDYRSVEREDVSLTSSGTVAVVTGKATFTVGLPDREITIVARFTSVWVDEDDTWRFFAWQNTPIPPG